MALIERFPDMVGMNGLTDLTGFTADWGGLGEFDRKMLDPLTVDGKLYALPALAFVDWIYYRADWFEEAGITAPPRTWDEFRQIARAITDPGRDRYGFGMRGGAGGGTAIIKVINSYNGPLTSMDGRSATPDLDAVVERHCMASIRNTNYYELGLVAPHLDRRSEHCPVYADGYSDDLQAVDEHGRVPVPQGPGLGVEIDWDWVGRHQTSEVVYE